MLQYVKETATNANIVFDGTIAKSTIARTAKRLKIDVANAQEKTDARAEAERDSRNAISMITMLSSAAKYVKFNANMLVNYDATQFELSRNKSNGNKKANHRVLVVKEENAATSSKPINCESKSHDLSYYLKYFAMIDRLCPNLVFLAADDKVDDDAFECIPIEGLTSSTDSAARGYLCFTKSRSGNDAFFNWMNQSV
jgi:hypothetical protein